MVGRRDWYLQPRTAANASQQPRTEPRAAATAYDHECSGSTLGTLDRCQRPVPVSLSNLLLVPDAPSAVCEDTVIWNVIRTHTRSRNTCSAKAVGTQST
jgi:hypothetical protein